MLLPRPLRTNCWTASVPRRASRAKAEPYTQGLETRLLHVCRCGQCTRLGSSRDSHGSHGAAGGARWNGTGIEVLENGPAGLRSFERGDGGPCHAANVWGRKTGAGNKDGHDFSGNVNGSSVEGFLRQRLESSRNRASVVQRFEKGGVVHCSRETLHKVTLTFWIADSTPSRAAILE